VKSTQAEQWRPIPGWEGHYEVSDQGRVRSLTRTVQYKDGRTRTFPGKILKLSADKDGYLMLVAKAGGVNARPAQGIKIHRAVLEVFVGECPKGAVAMHLNNNVTDNRAENLRWGTQQSNMGQMVSEGRHYLQKRTRCPRGHALEGPNLQPSALRIGKRTCLACDRARSYATRHGLMHEFKRVSDEYYAKIMA
jgi:hypothetical protein